LLRPTIKSLLRNWWPVLFWLGVIRAESTDTASATNTGSLLYTVIAFVAPHVEHSFVDRLNEVLRKTGHFIGYGILGALVFLALRNTNRDRLRGVLRRPWGIYRRDFWRLEWAVLGVFFTMITAAFDEIHQTFIPSRTGRWQDVALDTCGAAVIQLLIYFYCAREFRHHLAPKAESELSASR
jgi:VanZ family protein